ncbi:hypothetical protein H5410_057346, partial [Solanum commersonii]
IININTTRRFTEAVTTDDPLRVNIPPHASISATRSTHPSQNASTHVAPHSCNSIFAPIVAVADPGFLLRGCELISYCWLRPDEDFVRTILKCIGIHYDCVYMSWSSISLNTQWQMFNEFK